MSSAGWAKISPHVANETLQRIVPEERVQSDRLPPRARTTCNAAPSKAFRAKST